MRLAVTLSITNVFKLFGAAVSIAASALAHAQSTEWTTAQVVGAIEVTISSPATYYFGLVSPSSGWGSPSCPTATYVFVQSAAIPGARETLAIVSLARALGMKVQFAGTGLNAFYFLPIVAMLMPD